MKDRLVRSVVHVNWSVLAGCIAATTVLSLSIHILMLDGLGIPHPANAHVGKIAVLLNESLSVIAVIVFFRLARPHLDGAGFLGRWLILSALYAMLGEDLLRNFIMDVVVSHDWIYSLVENLARPLEILIVCLLVVITAPRLKAAWMIIAGGVAIAAIAIFALAPQIDQLFARIVASIEYLDTGNIYNPPYGWQVDVPSYLTFLEPVIAAYAIAALTFERLSPRPWRRLAQFVLLILAMKRSIVPTLLYSFYEARPLPAAMLSESQFALETLVMAVLTAVGWLASTGRLRRVEPGRGGG